MSLLTELRIFMIRVFYNYAAPWRGCEWHIANLL
jgi:hypothetical protein